MAITKMKKLTIAMMNQIREDILRDLQVLSAVQIDVLDTEDSRQEWLKDLAPVSVDVSTMEDQKKEIAMALANLSELTQQTLPSFEITSLETVNAVEKKYDVAELAKNFRDLDRKTKENETRLHQLKQDLAHLQQWRIGIDDMDTIAGTNPVLRGLAGQISESALPAFREALNLVTDLTDIVVCWTKDKEAFCYVVADPSVWGDVSAVIKEHPFVTIQITKRTGLTGDIINDLEFEITKTQRELDQAITSWTNYSSKINDLTLLHDLLEMKIQRTKMNAFAYETEQVSIMRAWVPEEFMPKVEAILSIYHKSIDLIIEDPREEEYETVPVLLKNNGLTRSYASLTNMYGTPMYGKTVDPTPHLSLFYFIYYGICMGDAIYGALLALFSLFMMFKSRANRKMADFFVLLAWSGFSAMVAGVIFGSYAGDLFTNYISVPALANLQFFYSDGQGFFDKPLVVLFFSLLIGAIQLFYGKILKFIVAIKNDGFVAFAEEFPWLLLLFGFFGWASIDWIGGLAGLSLSNPQVTNIFFTLMKVGAGLVILRSAIVGFKKSFISGLVGPLAGAWELYGITGYLSNLLSYARLLALGLSTGIISNVFNDLGFGMIGALTDITPILGIFGVVILIGLHLFNLILGGFGAFVHALRLQFVEFFGQFIEGGGKEFSPLANQGTHYTIK